MCYGGGYVLPQLDDYNYDALNRITSVTEAQLNSSGGWTFNLFTQNFNYDRWGNRTVSCSPCQPGVTGDVFTIDTTTNRITAKNGTGMTYDSAGNQTYDATGNRWFDGENRMHKAVQGGTTSHYVYDADGKRVRRIIGSTETWMIYGVDGELVGEYAAAASASSPQKEYGYRSGQMLIAAETSPLKITWLVTDHLGTPRMNVRGTGTDGGSLASVTRHDYLPFGEDLIAGIRVNGGSGQHGYEPPTDGVRQKFTGYERDDETGLDYAQARYYSSKQGRFTSPDEFTGGPDELYDFADVASNNPIFYADLTDPQSLNKYQYCYNDPLSTVDPDGHKGLRERLKEAVQVATDFAAGVAQGVGASVSYGLCSICNPSSNDSTAQRVGQWVGTGYVAVEGTATAIKGTAVIVTTGGTTTLIVAPIAVGGAVVAGGALKNVNALINTPISKSQSSQGQDFSPKTKKEIDARDGGTCQNCGREVRPIQNKKDQPTPVDQRQRHHIKPKKDGGDGSAENGTTLCPSCHKEEHRKLREAKKVKIENTN